MRHTALCTMTRSAIRCRTSLRLHWSLWITICIASRLCASRVSIRRISLWLTHMSALCHRSALLMLSRLRHWRLW